MFNWESAIRINLFIYSNRIHPGWEINSCWLENKCHKTGVCRAICSKKHVLCHKLNNQFIFLILPFRVSQPCMTMSTNFVNGLKMFFICHLIFTWMDASNHKLHLFEWIIPISLVIELSMAIYTQVLVI